MSTPIIVNYEPAGKKWAIQVTKNERSLEGSAPGLVAARDRADQLIKKLTKDAPKGQDAGTIVHLLQGDALAFSNAYLSARHGVTIDGYGNPTESAAVDAA